MGRLTKKTLSSRQPAVPGSSTPSKALSNQDIVDALTRAKGHLLAMTVDEACACCAGILLTLDVADFEVDWQSNGLGFEIIMNVILNQGDPITVVTVK